MPAKKFPAALNAALDAAPAHVKPVLRAMLAANGEREAQEELARARLERLADKGAPGDDATG